MRSRREAARLLGVILVLCVLCAWATHAMLAPANVLAFASLLLLCGA